MLKATPSQKVDALTARVKFPSAGKYVVAVSGGADSVALLDLLAKHRGLNLIVAHFDHAWREDSHLDAELVKSLGKILNLEVIVGRAYGQIKSEAAARQQRYDFLYNVAAMTRSAGVITAHHHDDQLETSLLNVVRGTARRGRSPRLSRPGLLRPLEIISKPELREYAESQGLPWREDSTNQDINIPRNFIRHELLPFSDQELPEFRGYYRQLIEASHDISQKLDRYLDRLIDSRENQVVFERGFLISQSSSVIGELLTAAVRRLEPGLQLTSKQLTELAHSVKTGRTGIKRDVAGRLSLEITRDTVAVVLPRVKGAADLE